MVRWYMKWRLAIAMVNLIAANLIVAWVLFTR
jgi:hypothetical protein